MELNTIIHKQNNQASIVIPPEVIKMIGGSRRKNLKITVNEKDKTILIHNGKKVEDFVVPVIPYDISKFIPQN